MKTQLVTSHWIPCGAPGGTFMNALKKRFPGSKVGYGQTPANPGFCLHLKAEVEIETVRIHAREIGRKLCPWLKD